MVLYLGVGVGIAVLGKVLRAAPRERIQKLEQARSALAQTEERLRLALHSSGIGVWSWDIAQNIIEADENCAVLFGLPMSLFPKTVEGFVARVHPDDRERVQQEVAASVDHGVEYDTEFRVVWPKGAFRHLAARGKVYYDESRLACRLTGVNWDVTERREAEENLRATAERFR